MAATEIVFGVRELTTHTDSDSESKNSDGENCGAQLKDQRHKEQSQGYGNFYSDSCFSLLCT